MRAVKIVVMLCGAAVLVLMGSWRVVCVVEAQEQWPTVDQLPNLYSKMDVMIPMRDGVRLHTEIYAPKNSAEALPFLLTRTPYGTSDDNNGFSGLFGIYRELIPEK